jgi:hypothetical protein
LQSGYKAPELLEVDAASVFDIAAFLFIMSGTLEPTQNQSLISFRGIDQLTDEEPINFNQAVAKREYAAGGFYNDDINIILHRHSDVLMSKFGDSIIAKMLRDPEVRKCDTVIKVSVLSDGITFFPAVSKPAELPPPVKDGETIDEKRKRLTREKEMERYDRAEKYAKFATRAIENLDTSFTSSIHNMLDAMTYGNKIAEQTYEETYDKDFGRTLLTLTSFRVKPRISTKFVVNKFKKLIGFEVKKKNSKGEMETVILPRDKFALLTFRGCDGDPRGQSILEPVYNAWYLKMQLWPEYMRWLLQCAIPSLVGYTPPAEQSSKTYLKDSQGNLIRDDQGNLVYEVDTESLLRALIQIRNGTAIALPNGAKVEPISNTVSGDPFKGMRDVLNEEIEMGILLQTLATSEGRNMSRAAAQTHMSVLDLLIVFIKGIVIDMIRNDILKPLFKINFDNFDMELLPNVSMGDIERRDWGADAVAIATLWKSGFMGESQKVGYDKFLTAPDRDVESDRTSKTLDLKQQAEAKQAASAQNVPNNNSNNNSSSTSDTQASFEALKELKQTVQAYEQLHGEIII